MARLYSRCLSRYLVYFDLYSATNISIYHRYYDPLVLLTFFKSIYFKQTFDTIKLFKGLYNDIILAGDFKEDGSFVDESINIEIMPIQSKEVYFKIKQILIDKFNIDNFESCDKLFDDYSIEKFHFHVKIKYSVNELVVKFYNTYPVNPFINYYDNKKKFR